MKLYSLPPSPSSVLFFSSFLLVFFFSQPSFIIYPCICMRSSRVEKSYFMFLLLSCFSCLWFSTHDIQEYFRQPDCWDFKGCISRHEITRVFISVKQQPDCRPWGSWSPPESHDSVSKTLDVLHVIEEFVPLVTPDFLNDKRDFFFILTFLFFIFPLSIPGICHQTHRCPCSLLRFRPLLLPSTCMDAISLASLHTCPACGHPSSLWPWRTTLASAPRSLTSWQTRFKCDATVLVAIMASITVSLLMPRRFVSLRWSLRLVAYALLIHRTRWTTSRSMSARRLKVNFLECTVSYCSTETCLGFELTSPVCIHLLQLSTSNSIAYQRKVTHLS